jgi:NAD(P)-dependent dehydrogenase (short-subunit alcohol dehydrogenase family)
LFVSGSDRFQSHVVVVVGANEPVGSACVELFRRQGATVIGIDVIGDGSAFHVVADRIDRDCGRVDVLVYAISAMEQSGRGLLGLSLDRWHEIIEVNMTGLLICVRELAGLLRRAPHASVVIQASVDGHLGNPHVPAYSVTKGAQVIMTHMLAAELADDGIRVNCVALAGIPIHVGALSDEFRASTVRETPLGRLGHASEVAQAVAFLASSESSYVTGASLTVDGGRLAVTPGTSLGRS